MKRTLCLQCLTFPSPAATGEVNPPCRIHTCLQPAMLGHSRASSCPSSRTWPRPVHLSGAWRILMSVTTKTHLLCLDNEIKETSCPLRLADASLVALKSQSEDEGGLLLQLSPESFISTPVCNMIVCQPMILPISAHFLFASVDLLHFWGVPFGFHKGASSPRYPHLALPSQ